MPWPSGENAISRALRDRREPYVDLTESNPTRAGLLPAAQLAALSDPRALRYEPHPKGLLAGREAVAAYYADSRGAAVDPERIVLLASTSEAYALLFKLLCDPGDCVLVPEPSYPLFGLLTALEGVEAVPYPLRFDGEWHLDAAALQLPPRARAVLVVSPGNPTGAFLKQEERAALAERCAGAGCALICDEVFADFALVADPQRVPTVAAHGDVLAFALSGLSKVCGLPQLKLGWCAVSGPPDEVSRAVQRLELIADTYLSVATPVQLAAGELLRGRHDFQRRVLDRIRSNRAALLRARSAAAPWDVLPAEGGWSAILSVPRSRSEDGWVLALLEAGVLVHPGYFFDFPAGAHLVLSLLGPEGDFARAAAALAEVIRSS
ncbi:MAG: pyridoxal phosphate-dependent aminotransferase [Myxococcales bacterium]